MAVIDELLVGLGFDYNDKQLTKYRSDLKKTTDLILDFAKVAAAGAAALTGLAVTTTAASDSQGKLADEVGIAVDQLDALQFANQRAGGSAEGMADSLQQLSIRASEASRGLGSGVEAFGLLGISATDANGELKPTVDLMLEVSRVFQGLNKAKQIELADKLGLRGSIRLLQAGPQEIRNLIKEAEDLGVTTGEDAAIAAEFQDTLTNLWQTVKSGSRILTRILAPAIKDIVDPMIEWWKTSKDLIESNLEGWVRNVTTAFKLLTLALGLFLGGKLLMSIGGIVTALKGMSIAALAASASALLLPTLIGTGIAAFLALVDEAKTFFEGGDTYIGDLIEKYPEWTEQIHAVAAAFATVADLTELIWEGWKAIFDLFTNTTFEDIKEFFGNLPGFLGDVTGLAPVEGGGLLSDFGSTVSNTASTVVDKIDIVIQGGVDTASQIADSVFNIFQQTTQELNSPVDQ